MTLDRRHLLQIAATGAAGLVIGGRHAFAVAGPIDAIADDTVSHFGRLGFGQVPPLGLITGDEYNDGLRYDETRPEPPVAPELVIQPVARVSDIAERDRPGVLPGFNIIGLQKPGPADGSLLALLIDFLVRRRGLDPNRMLYVSTEELAPHIERIDTLASGTFYERSAEEAVAAGDGSGVFAPPGHPNSPNFHSVGVYYPLPGTAPGTPAAYPPDGYIEIAEIGIPLEGEGDQAAGIGLERLALAEGETVPDFEETLLNLLRTIEDEAARTGKPLPDGYTKFASL
ncbi:MAG: hypothetical protein KDJ86_00730 [Bauldia sp.]|uniref:hypothetical protein n=1 Tax=Bauldia sp. TaxID=2575872 RepID=UPI001D45DAFE|nr:hypothetical protein [Bauldia sp.]MCB1490147.1 hypothetical protein [Bauldia sp.]MCB1494282.1 hypothetical protein [Bauldia sp.]